MYNLMFKFPNFNDKFLTFSYDDGTIYDVRLAEIFKKYNLKGTFNVNTELTENENRLSMSKLRELYEKTGMEVAVHGAKHVHVANYPSPTLTREFIIDKQNLETEFKTVIRGMAYAYGSYSDVALSILDNAGIKYGRTTNSTLNFDIPDNFLLWNPTCHHANPKLFELLDEFLNKPVVKIGITLPRLFYVWGHSYEFNNNNNWELIEEFCQKASGKTDVWYATNIEIYDYVTAYRNLSFSVDLKYVYNPSAIDVYVLVQGNKVIAKAGKITKIGE